MGRSRRKVDKVFLYNIFILVGVGVAVFISASLGILAKDKNLFTSVLFSQLILGLGLGFLLMYITLKIDYRFWRKYAFVVFILSLLLTLAVFIPAISLEHGGAQRWISLGPVSLQPVEVLKFGFIIYFAAWLNWIRTKVKTFKWGLLPFLGMLGVIGVILINQPDTKSLILISFTGLSMLLLAGAKLKHIILSFVVIGICFGALVYFTPYLKDRINTYINPSADEQDTSWQIKQSWIAIGSGGIFGRGYGQSIQKFTYLPEAHGDSIFAVLGEEFGFIGTTTIVFLYLFFVLRGFRIASRAPDNYSRLLVSGIVIMIGAQAFMHIAAVTGVFPLTGVPLPFMSQGGTSLMIYLASMGVVLQISRYRRNV